MESVVEQTGIGLIRPVRQAVLYPEKPGASAIYSGDEHPKTLHLSVSLNGVVAGVATLLPEDETGVFHSGEPGKPWRIRGMAVLPEHRGSGLGQILLSELLRQAAAFKPDYLWCNARKLAIRLYERAGFQIRGEEFELPGIGPHFRMILAADSERASGLVD